jgi:hypothetical protein
MPSKADDKREAVIFIRTRSVPYNATRDQMSIEIQRRHCQQVAEELGATVIGEYVAVGGTRERVTQDTIQTMCDQVARRPVDYIITMSIDRFSRSLRDTAALCEAISATGAQLVANGNPLVNGLAALTVTASERSPL